VDAALAGCKPGTPVELTYRIRHKNGDWVWLLDRNYPTRLPDGRIAFAGIALDVSALKHAEQALEESEERFDLAMRFTKDGLYDWDLRTNEIYYSPGWKRMLGYEPEEVADELSEWERLTHEQDVKAAYAQLQDLLEGNRSRFEREIRMRHKDGHWVDVLARGNVVFDENGAGVRVVGTHVDITNRKRMETDLAALAEAKGQLLKELNHRVKNNLQMVSSLVRLKDAALGPEVDLSDIVSQIAAIRGLHEILSVAEDVRAVQLRDYLDHILSTVFSLARGRVHVRNDVGDASVASSTAVAIGLIVNEMATNAMKHGFGTEPATFSIEMITDTYTRQSVLIISNSGSPVPDEVDLDNPRTIGLRLISALASQLGARLEMQRSPNPVFTLRLPAPQKSTESEVDSLRSSERPNPGASSAGA
jgi:PAS domain S-box-containing protein